ncbi:MAG: hypothetical protein A2W91_12045 [Bacteroidetes bacterium GWF2_38_335]|nr:MAG: hypothetical protein A2W91_12045 [Bacteroidetes bacterium GWF2_38_335]OFY76904.1 MAG: hypothetical protein A2281_00160 [Bacteroidetes bacterium RIFOXYA12_FULL_38_20]HBS86753.1 hypothetical protein [Bacteroidales bacterium]
MTVEHISELLEDLTERNKELNCLYNLEEILKDFEASYENIFERIIEIIPGGWRYSEICKARITYGDITVESWGIKNTELKQAAFITAEGEKIGEIQVYYIKPVKQEKGIFLTEERKLINSIAEKIGNYIAYKKLKEYIKKIDGDSMKKTKIPAKEEKLISWLKEQNLSEKEIQQMTRVKIVFKKGENICKQGSFATYIMLLTEGLTRASLEGTQERGFNYKISKPFSFIGLSTLYGDNYYHFSTSAIIPSTLYLIDRKDFDDIVKSNPGFASSIMGWYCKNFKLVYNKLSCIANKQALGKIAETLIYLSSEVFESERIDNSISRRDIAELSGMSTESAVRILSELKKDNIIRITSQCIEIADMKLLKTISSAG